MNLLRPSKTRVQSVTGFLFCNVRSTSEALWGWECLKMLEKTLKSSGRSRNSSHVCPISPCAIGLGLRLRPLPCIGRRWTHFEPHRRFAFILRRLAAVLAEGKVHLTDCWCANSWGVFAVVITVFYLWLERSRASEGLSSTWAMSDQQFILISRWIL